MNSLLRSPEIIFMNSFAIRDCLSYDFAKLDAVGRYRRVVL